MKKMTSYEDDIFKELVILLRKINQLETETQTVIVSETFLKYMSVAIEDLTGLGGIAEHIFSDDSEEKDLEKKSKLD